MPRSAGAPQRRRPIVARHTLLVNANYHSTAARIKACTPATSCHTSSRTWPSNSRTGLADAGPRGHRMGWRRWPTTAPRWAPIRHAGADALHERRPALQVVSVSALCTTTISTTAPAWAGRCGARGGAYTVACLPRQRSLSHRFAQTAGAGSLQDLEPFLEALDHESCIWKRGTETSAACCRVRRQGHGEGFMHDTAMLLGPRRSDYTAGRGDHAVFGARARQIMRLSGTPQEAARSRSRWLPR